MWAPVSWQLRLVGDPSFGAGTQTVMLQSAFPQPGGARLLAAASPPASCSSATAPMRISRDAT
jgi:hypothetical protein